LFIAIYLDEDVGVVIANLLSALRFRAVTARDAGRLGYSDPEQLAYAATQGFCALTHNREDFEELHRQYLATGRNHSGIIIAVRRPPYEISDCLLRLIYRFTADEMRNQLLYI